MKWYYKLGLGMGLAAIVAGASLKLYKQEVSVETSIEKKEGYKEKPTDITFLLGSHANMDDADQINKELASPKERKYDLFLVESPLKYDDCTLINQFLDNLVTDYMNNHNENVLGHRDDDYRKRIREIFFDKNGRILAENVIQAAKLECYVRFFEAYEPEDYNKFMETKKNYMSAVEDFNTQPSKDKIENLVDKFAASARYRNKLMKKRIELMQDAWDRNDTKVLFFMGMAHKPVADSFEDTEQEDYTTKEMNLNVAKPAYTRVLLKKINNPEYKMTEEEEEALFKEFQ
ncbi:hypothetical protein KY332_01105 [Candidatus Woesearchaeota archaeon]|nr:hypothetical protein [Candidatus Woesearchaeota archaeon]